MSADPSDIEAAGVKEGDVLAGKYRVDRVLGVGGMGVVVAAHHLHLDEHVAIKFLLPSALANAEAVARFDREARAAVKIKSEHVARVIDVGKLENGAPYMVMEYLEGRDLSAWLTERGPLPVEQAVDFVLQASEAIAEAHAMGVVHRDLKPANLYCIRRPDGALSIKVLDFGISKASGPAGSMSMTRTTAVMGSPLYMSPEQMESSKAVDPRADIWALGVILFELVTGRVPFEGEAITELVLKIVTAQPPLVAGMLPGIPPGLDPIIQRCLAKNRDHRYASVAELANDLLPLGPPSARLSVERIANIMGAAGQPARRNFHSSPPGVAATQAMAGSRPSITGGGAAGVQQGPQGAGGQLPRMTDAAWGNTGGAPAPRQGPKLALVLGGAALLMLLTGGAVLLVTRKAAPPAVTTSPTVAAAPSSPPSAIVVDPPAAPSESAVAAAPPSSAPASTVAPAAPTAARPSGPGRPASPGTTPVVAPAKPAGKPSCDPPYFMDSSGHRQYKPECL